MTQPLPLQPAHPRRVDWLRGYTAYCRDIRGLPARTIAEYRRCLDRYWSWYATCGTGGDPADAGPADLARYLNARRPPGGNRRGAYLAANTRAAYTATIKLCYTWAARSGRIPTDPLAEVRIPKPGRPVARDLPADDIDALFGHLDGLSLRMRAVGLLAYVQAFRTCEIATARREDLRLGATPTLTIHRKGAFDQRIPLHPTVAAVLGELVAGYDRPRGALIEDARPAPACRGRHISTKWVGVLLSEAMTAAGIAESGHALRHTAATRLREAGVPLTDIAELLGHRRLEQTKRYCMGASDVAGRAALALLPIPVMPGIGMPGSALGMPAHQPTTDPQPVSPTPPAPPGTERPPGPSRPRDNRPPSKPTNQHHPRQPRAPRKPASARGRTRRR